MVEIKGFNEAYNNMLAIEAMKKIKKADNKEKNKRIDRAGSRKRHC